MTSTDEKQSKIEQFQCNSKEPDLFFSSFKPGFHRVFSHDVTSAILVSQNNETAAILVSQTNPVGDELFSYANDFFCSKTFA